MSTDSAQVFARFVPLASVDYCNEIYQSLSFELKIKKSRQSKFGDFRYDLTKKKQTITINNDLNPFHFLITYLHEVAHLITFKEHGTKVPPHGKEWKNNFKRVMTPVLKEDVFPRPVLDALHVHLSNPKATSCSDPALYQVMQQYDQTSDNILLKEIRMKEVFEFNGKVYRKLEKRRTRSLCEQLSSKKKYLIAEIASVKRIEEG